MPASPILPMAVTGVRHLVERAYRESGELQYLRELVVNSIEAGATRIEFGPEWNAVKGHGVYRLMVADDGNGMGPDELLRFLNTFGGGGKPIGDLHENFGVGAKTSLLPWNHEGVVVLSWTPGCGSGPVPANLGKHVWLFFNAAAGSGLMSWVDQKTSCDSKALRRTPCAYSSDAALAQVAMDCQLESLSNPVVHVGSRLRSPVAVRYARSLVSTGDGDGDGSGNGGGGGGGGNGGQPDGAGSLYQLAATTGLGSGLAYEEATVFVSRDGATTKLLAQGALS